MNKHLCGLRWFPSGQSRAAQKLGLDPEAGGPRGHAQSSGGPLVPLSRNLGFWTLCITTALGWRF